MRKLFTTFLIVLVGLLSYSQNTIKLEDVAKHVGDSVKICGKVYGIRFVSTVQNEPTFINLGANFPNQLLTIVIWSDVRKTFTRMPEELFKDKEVCVTGKIELYKERPQVVVRDKGQLVLKE